MTDSMPQNEPAARRAVRVAVTGMHRSGTSFVARMVDLMGIDLGPDSKLMEAKPDNPKGFWEHQELTAIADDLMDHLGGRWDHAPSMLSGWELDPALEPYRERVRSVIEADFAGSGPIGFKDPRTSILLPFWRTVVDVESTLCCLRDPREVARSLRVRNGMDAETVSRLWLRYTAHALINDPETLVVQYPMVLDADDAALDEIADHIGLERPSDEVRAGIREHADPALHHHGDQVDELPPAGSLAHLALSIYRAVIDLDRYHLLPILEALHFSFVGTAELAQARDDVAAMRAERDSMERHLQVKNELLARAEAATAALSGALEREREAAASLRAQAPRRRPSP